MFKRFFASMLYPIIRPAVEQVIRVTVAEAVRFATQGIADAQRRLQDQLNKLPPVPPPPPPLPDA